MAGDGKAEEDASAAAAAAAGDDAAAPPAAAYETNNDMLAHLLGGDEEDEDDAMMGVEAGAADEEEARPAAAEEEQKGAPAANDDDGQAPATAMDEDAAKDGAAAAKKKDGGDADDAAAAADPPPSAGKADKAAAAAARTTSFFVLQGADQKNVARSQKEGLWFASNEAISRRLAERFSSGGGVVAFVTVRGTGKFSGAVELLSAPGGEGEGAAKEVDWAGVDRPQTFAVKWLQQTPLPFSALAHIKSAGGGGGPVTRAADGEEIGEAAGRAVLLAFEQGPPFPAPPRAPSAGGAAAQQASGGPLDLADISYEQYRELHARVQAALHEAKAKVVPAAAATAPAILSENSYVAQTISLFHSRGMVPPAEAAIRMHYRQQRAAVEGQQQQQQRGHPHMMLMMPGPFVPVMTRRF